MADKILVIGNSGSGKSRSTLNLDPKTTFYINCIGKPLPYKGWKAKYTMFDKASGKGNMVSTWDYDSIIKGMKYISDGRSEIKTIVVDDAQYIMSYEFMNRAKERGFDKFVEIAQHMFDVLVCPDNLREDLMVIFLSHSEESNYTTKMKTIGKMLDEKITIEGLFTVVLMSYSEKDSNDKMKYMFMTNSNGSNTCKSPEDMFPLTMENDLSKVIELFNKYNTG